MKSEPAPDAEKHATSEQPVKPGSWWARWVARFDRFLRDAADRKAGQGCSCRSSSKPGGGDGRCC